MDKNIPSSIRQIIEQQVKGKITPVYPNVLPDVLALEARMIESKAFATSKSLGEYMVSSTCYISAHTRRENGAQYVQRIPALTQQEEKARLDQMRKSLSLGEDKAAQNSYETFPPKKKIGAVHSNTPLTTAAASPTQPIPGSIRSSAQSPPARAGSSRQPPAAGAVYLRRPSSSAARRPTQPSPAAAVPPTNPFAKPAMPQPLGLSDEKIQQVQKALAEQRDQALKTHQVNMLKEKHANALHAQNTERQLADTLQKQQTLAQQTQNATAVRTQQSQSLQALQSQVPNPQAVQPQAQWTHAQQAHSTKALQMQQLQGLPAAMPHALQTRRVQALQEQQERAGGQAQQPLQIRQQSRMQQNGNQLGAVSKKKPNSQAKCQTQHHPKTYNFARGLSHSQVIAPPQTSTPSQTEPSPFTNDQGQLQTIEQTSNVPQINHSRQKLIQPTVRTLPQNHTLSEMNALMPPQNNIQAQGPVQNQVLPVASSTPQVQPLPQPQMPPEMLTDEALNALSPDQLRSLLKQAYDPSRRVLQAPSQVQDSNAQTLLKHTSANTLSQLSARPAQASSSAGHLKKQQALKQVTVPQGQRLHPPMAKSNEKKSQGVPFVGMPSQGMERQLTRKQGQNLLQTSQNQVGTLPTAQSHGLQARRVSNAVLNPQTSQGQVITQAGNSQLPISSKTQALHSTANNTEQSIFGQAQNQASGSLLGNQSIIGQASSVQANLAPQAKVSRLLVPQQEAVTQTMLAQNSGSPAPTSREKQVHLANWITFQKEYRTRLDRIFPVLEALFTPNPTENEKRTLKNILTIRTALHQNATRLADSHSANSTYHSFLNFVRNVFEKYRKYEHITKAEAIQEAGKRRSSGARSTSLQTPGQLSQSTHNTPLNGAKIAEALLSQMQQAPSTNPAIQPQDSARNQISNPHVKIPQVQKGITKPRIRAQAAPHRMETAPKLMTRIGNASSSVYNSHVNTSNRNATRAEKDWGPTSEATTDLNERKGNVSKEFKKKEVLTRIQEQSVNLDTVEEPNSTTQAAESKRSLPSSRKLSGPDLKRVEAIVKRHVRSNVEKNLREYVGNYSISSGGNPGQAQTRYQNTNNQAEESEILPKMTGSENFDRVPAPGPPFDSRQVIQGTRASSANPSASDLLTGNNISVATAPVNLTNSSTGNQAAISRCPADRNSGTQRVNVPTNAATPQQSTEDGENRTLQDSPSRNSGKTGKKHENPNAASLLQDLKGCIGYYTDLFAKDPILNGSIQGAHIDTRTDEEAISDLQGAMDGTPPRKRNARVEETLKDLRSGRTESKEGRVNDLNPIAKKQKKLSLREAVEFDCDLINEIYDSVNCLIQEELDKQVVICSVHIGEHRIPNLKVTVLEGYPSEGKGHYIVETPPSGWIPQYDTMKSRFLESMRSEDGKCSLHIVVSNWLTAVQSVLTSE